MSNQTIHWGPCNVFYFWNLACWFMALLQGNVFDLFVWFKCYFPVKVNAWLLSFTWPPILGIGASAQSRHHLTCMIIIHWLQSQKTHLCQLLPSSSSSSSFFSSVLYSSHFWSPVLDNMMTRTCSSEIIHWSMLQLIRSTPIDYSRKLQGIIDLHLGELCCFV